MINNTG